MTKIPCFILTCRLPARADALYIRPLVAPQPACQPHYDAIMAVLGEQATLTGSPS